MINASSGHEILVRLLDLTPEPGLGADAEHLLAAFETIVAQRAEILAAMAPPISLGEPDRPLLAELERRQAMWQDALAEALRAVGEQRCGTVQLRAYAQPG